MCYKRGQQTASEGAFLILQQLTGEAWAASETIDLDVLDTGERPFDEIFDCLDRLYQYEPEVEMPLRCEEFFSSFQRNSDETLNAYIARHGQVRARLHEAGVDLPDRLAGWHLMSRSGISKWHEPTLRAMCRNDLTVANVSAALKSMFGGDSKPSSLRGMHRRRARRGAEDGDGMVAESDEDEEYDPEEPAEYDEYYEEEFYDPEDDEEVPPELEEAADQCEEALAAYHESRMKMRELATARGF